MHICFRGAILVGQLWLLVTPFYSAAKEHPHLFFDRSGMEALRDRALNNSRVNKIWIQFKSDQVDEAMKVKVEDGDFGDVSLGREIGDALATLTIAYIVLEEKKYASKAEDIMRALAARSSWGGNRLVKAHISMGVAFCWDVMYDRFSKSTRDQVLASIRRNADNTLYADVYANANWTGSAGEGLVGLAFEGDGDTNFNKFVQGLLESAKNNFKEKQNSVLWAHGADGFPHEGLAYWRKYIHVGLFLKALRQKEPKNDWFHLGREYPGSEFLQNTAFSRIYAEVQHPDLACLTWGDAIAVRGKYGGMGVLSMVASEYNDGYALDFMDYLIDEAGFWFRDEDWATFVFYDDSQVPQQSFRSLPLSRYWPDQEAAIFRSGWDKNALLFFMRSGSPGGHGRRLKGLREGIHDHLDANGFVLFYNNDYLATEDGYVPVLGSYIDSNKKFTEGHNTFLIDGQGQRGEGTKFAATTQANMDYLDDEHIGYLLGDATDAYEGINRFYRYVVYKKHDYVVILDELQDDASHKYEFLLGTDHRHKIASHGKGKFSVKPTDGSAQLLVDFVASQSLESSISRDRIYSVPEKYTDMLRIWPKKDSKEAAFLSLHYPLRASNSDPAYEKIESGGLLGFVIRNDEYFLYNAKGKSYDYGEITTDATLCYYKASEKSGEFLIAGGSEFLYQGLVGMDSNKPLVATLKGTSGKIRLGKNLGEGSSAEIRLFYPGINGVLVDGEPADIRDSGANFVEIKLKPKQYEIGPAGYRQTVTDNYDFQILTDSFTPFVEITHPLGGETLSAGQAATIEWRSDGSFPSVKIEYSRDGGDYWQTVASSAPNNGHYDWTVPNAVSNSALLRISDAADGLPNDVSDTVFSVVQESHPQAPTIVSFRPTNGPIGTTVTITGHGFTDLTLVQFSGLNASFSVTAGSIEAVVPPNAATGRLRVASATGEGLSEEDFLVNEAGASRTYHARSDTYVRSSKPLDTFGGKKTLEVRKKSSSEFRSYLKFAIPGEVGFQSAKLRLFVDNESEIGGEIYQVSNFYRATGDSWDEDGLTWENAPEIDGPVLAGLGTVTEGLWVEFDVSQAVLENGEMSFAIMTTSSDRVEYDSKEGTNPAQLVIYLGDSTLPSPALTSFVPDSGVVGTTVTILGQNLAGTTKVTFNGTAADFNVSSGSDVIATVPENATTGTVSLTTSAGTVQSEQDFTVTSFQPQESVPEIAGFYPQSGPAGTVVTITGKNLAACVQVEFNGVEAPFTVQSEGEIQATLPAAASTGRIGVANPTGLGLSEHDFSVPQVGADITLLPKSDTYVRSTKPTKSYGGKSSLEVRRKTSAEYRSYLKFDLPALTSFYGASLRLKVKNASERGGEIYAAGNFYNESTTPWSEDELNWENAPLISGPPIASLGAVDEGDTVQFDVSNAVFEAGEISFAIQTTSSDRVEFDSKEGDHPPQLIIYSDATPPPSAPVITAFSPNRGSVGTEVTIQGQGLAGTTKVTFDDIAAEFVPSSNSGVIATVPTNASTGRVSLVTPFGTAFSAQNFNITSPSPVLPPKITGFSPEGGAIGSVVLISGNNFGEIEQLRFNGVLAQFTIQSDGEIQATVPEDATTGKITVAKGADTQTSDKDFQVTSETPQTAKIVHFFPTDDAFARQKKPNNNYGTADELRVRKTSKSQLAFLRFDLSELTAGVEEAKLRLLCVDGSDDGGNIFVVPGDWSEGRIDWNSAPQLGSSPLASLGPVKAGQTVEVDLTAVLEDGSVQAFAIKNASSDVVIYSSKEGKQVPELVITTAPSAVPLTAKFVSDSGAQLDADRSFRDLPNEFTLWPNYPNPFNLATTVTYSLPEAAEVELSIYNMRGQKVKRLVSEFMPAGVHTVRWHGQTSQHSEVSSGVYILALRAEGVVLNKRIILLK